VRRRPDVGTGVPAPASPAVVVESPSTAELRIVSVLFIDLVGFTALGVRGGDADPGGAGRRRDGSGRRGRVTSQVAPGEPPFEIRTMGPGSYVGEIGVLQQIPRTATVSAATELYRIDAGDFRDALTELPPATTFLDLARARLARAHPTEPFHPRQPSPPAASSL
jgi:hypothetical protein